LKERTWIPDFLAAASRCDWFSVLAIEVFQTRFVADGGHSFAKLEFRKCLTKGFFVLLPNRPRTAHNETVTDRGNVVKNLFVGNLGSEVTLEELRRLFEAYGQVVQVHIIVDRDTGLPRGFAFVEMTNDAEAEKAIRALNDSILRDRTLDVNYARPRPERPAA
jgi:hypothetical protein